MPTTTPSAPPPASSGPTPPPGRQPHRGSRSHYVVALVMLLVGALVGYLIGHGTASRANVSLSRTSDSGTPTPTPTPTAGNSTPSPSASATPSPSASATQSPSASAAAAPATASCVSLNAASNHLSVTLRYPASSSAAIGELTQLRGAKYTDLMYSGDFASAGDIKTWIAAAKCSGFAVTIELDTAFAHFKGDNAGLTSYVKSIDGQAGLVGYALSMNSNTTGASAGDQDAPGSVNLNREVDLVKAVTTKSVAPLVDFVNTDDPADGIRVTKQYHGDFRLPVFLPVGNSYGPPALYTKVGQLAAAVDGNKSWAAVQAVAQGSGAVPSAVQVAQFAQLVKAGGTKNILVYTEEPPADQVSYLKAIAQKINPGTICVTGS